MHSYVHHSGQIFPIRHYSTFDFVSGRCIEYLELQILNYKNYEQ